MRILCNACRPVYSLTHVCMSDETVRCSQPRAISTLKMQTEIVASPEVTAAIQELLPALDGINVSSVSIFPNARPGEPQFWTAYAYRDGQRNVFSTSEMRHLPLDEQAPSLCEQLVAFIARLQTTPAADILFLGISGVLHPSTSLYLLARGVQPWGDNHRRYEGVPTLERALAPYPWVRIVLTSTQPWAHSLATVIAELGPAGCACRRIHLRNTEHGGDERGRLLAPRQEWHRLRDGRTTEAAGMGRNRRRGHALVV